MNFSDCRDLYELGKIVMWADDKEEIQAALVAMREILEEEPMNKDLIEALDIMDSKGKHNPEGNSMMLWNKDWNRLRAILFRTNDSRNQ